MDSPVRKMQKKNDYNRHKLFRKIKRRRRAQAELLSRIAEKELKKKLRVTPPRFDDGKVVKNLDDDLVDWIIREEGFSPSPVDIGDGKITLGSGLTDKKWIDAYNKSGKWTVELNKQAVREEVANRRKWAETSIPNWDSLPSSSQKALLSYKYNYDFTPLNSPKLFKALSDSDLHEAARQMDATSKISKFKKGLLERRQREQQWFLQDVQKRPIIQPVETNYYEYPVSTRVDNPHAIRETVPPIATVMVPANGNYVQTRQITPEEVSKQRFEKRMKRIKDFDNLMKAASIIDVQLSIFDFLNRPFGGDVTTPNVTTTGYKSGKATGFVRDKDNNPIAFDTEGNLVDQVTGDKGTMMLPEVTVSPSRYTRDLYSSAFEGNQDKLMDMVSLAPIAGDAIDAYAVYNDLNKGNYLAAGIGAGMLALPNFIEKPIKGIGKIIRKTARGVKDFPWVYKIPENEAMAYRIMDSSEKDWLLSGNPLSSHRTNPAAITREQMRPTKHGRTFNIFKQGAEHGGRKQFAKGHPWQGSTVTHGEKYYLAIPGKDIQWVSGRHYVGPEGTGFGAGPISFETAPIGSHIDIKMENGLESTVNPSLLDGSVIYSPFKIFGHNFGYKKSYPTDIIDGYKNGKTSSGIHIKPSHRGRLTALKKRTGKSEAELYKTGSAATRKMITFARNARKWNK